MAAIRCAAAGIALVRRAAAGGQRGALQQIFSSLRPRGIHSLLDRPLGAGAGAVSSPTSSMGPARCAVPSNRYMSTSRFQKGHGAPTKEPSAKIPWYKRMSRPQETEGVGFMLCMLTLTVTMLQYDAWDSYDEFASRFGEFSSCEFSVPQISQRPTAAWSVLDKTRDFMLEREPPSST